MPMENCPGLSKKGTSKEMQFGQKIYLQWSTSKIPKEGEDLQATKIVQKSWRKEKMQVEENLSEQGMVEQTM